MAMRKSPTQSEVEPSASHNTGAAHTGRMDPGPRQKPNARRRSPPQTLALQLSDRVA